LEEYSWAGTVAQVGVAYLKNEKFCVQKPVLPNK
jgi:hypothetical protein